MPQYCHKIVVVWLYGNVAVGIGNWIYWTLTILNYNSICGAIANSHGCLLSLTSPPVPTSNSRAQQPKQFSTHSAFNSWTLLELPPRHWLHLSSIWPNVLRRLISHLRSSKLIFLLTVSRSETFLLLNVGRPLWGEDGSVICSAITHWLETYRILNHHLVWDSTDLDGQVPVFISPRNRTAQLHPWALHQVKVKVTLLEGQYVFLSATQFFSLFLIIFRQLWVCWLGVPSLTRCWVCTFQFLLVIARAALLKCESQGTHEHISLSLFWDSPNLEGQVPVFISPRNRVAQLYP
jgi:hypothetical protein